MNIQLKQDNGLTTATLVETRLDASVAPEFKAAMEKIIASGSDQLILDISQLSFMDSSSLGAMVAVLKQIGGTGKMVILGASWAVLELFKLTRMDRIFTLLIKDLIPAAGLGILLGGLSFHYFNAGAIRLLLGVLAVAFTLNYWFKRKVVKKHASTYWGWFWSSLTGFTSFIAHAGGPPINAYLLPLRLEKSVYQGTCVLLFTLINYIKLIPYFWLGQLNADNLATSLVLLPLAFVGVFIGIKLHKRISEQLFYQLTYLFLFITGLKLLWDGVRSFM